MNNKSIVSLSADASQVIEALGLAHLLAGCSSDSVFSTKTDPVSVCAEWINGELRLNEQLLKSLNAQLIVLDERELENSIRSLLPNTEILSLNFDSLGNLYSSIRKIAAGLEQVAEGELLVENCDERVNIIIHKIKFITARPTVLCLKNTVPLSVADNRMEELITVAGGLPMGKNYDATNIAETRPDILLLMCDKGTIQQALQPLAERIASGQWANLPAVINNKVFVTEKAQKGSLAINDLEMLAEIINDGDFYFGYEGERWIRFETA